jgi:hypothetical protein
MSTMAERRKLARLYLIVAAVNDYRLTVRPLPSWDDLKCAEQELIDLDNAQGNKRPVTNLALDLIEQDIHLVEMGLTN